MSEKKPSALEMVLSICSRVRGRVEALALPEGIDARWFPRGRLQAALCHLERRLREGGRAPLRVALFGPTGVGKSKLFNSLAGKELSPAGFRRPFTQHPVYLVHAGQETRLGGRTEGVRTTSEDAWRNVILIDTPDFDSVESSHRKEAERVFGEAEAFLFITDAQKYADHSTWEYLERIFRERKPVILILNKVVGDGAPRDFQARLKDRFGLDAVRAQRVLIRELPLDDTTPIPADDPGLEQLQVAFRRLVGTPEERQSLLRERLREDIDLLLDEWGAVESRLRRYLEGLEKVERRLEERRSALQEELKSDLEGDVDPAARAEVYSRVLQGLQRIDILRYPRRLIALPVEGLKSAFRRWLPRRAGKPAASPEEVARQESFEVLEAKVLALTAAVSAETRSLDACPDLLTADDLSRLRFSHEELRGLHDETESEFSSWLHREATDTASRLTGEHKLKFILSQVIYNSVVVGVQIHTAGGFTFAELLTDGVLSPLVAKAVGIAVSSEAVAGFCRSAREERARLQAGILDRAAERLAEHLRALGAWRMDFEKLAALMDSLGRERQAVLEAFEESARLPLPDSGSPREGGAEA